MALACLCAALFSIVVYGATASRFGIPTSQSHSLIAGLTGAAIALGGASSVNVHEWMKVIYGLALSIGLGFIMGWVLCKLVSILSPPPTGDVPMSSLNMLRSQVPRP